MLTYILLIWIHFISDFLLQNNYMAEGKSDSVYILLLHSFVYSILFSYFEIEYAIINGCLHFLVDGYTSMLTKHFYMIRNRRMFFITIGADQVIHLTFLFLTLKLF